MAETFDAIFTRILKDIKNNCPDADVTQGSVLYANAAALASAEWGLQNKLDNNAKQIFPASASSALLERHCAIYRIFREPDETDAELLARLEAREQQPPAGGNANDYETWAKEVDGVAAARCVPAPQGAGTVDVVILADAAATGSETPGDALVAAVYAYIDARRPVTAGTFRVVKAQIIMQDVTMTAPGPVDWNALGLDVTALLNGMTIGGTLTIASLASLALTNGADDAVCSMPYANVAATPYQVIRARAVTVNTNLITPTPDEGNPPVIPPQAMAQIITGTLAALRSIAAAAPAVPFIAICTNTKQVMVYMGDITVGDGGFVVIGGGAAITEEIG
ncbi:MAG: baseplate J/gp47 family protein [Elusimicrobiales bacterium]